jgi:LuxR family maltose regulon positive regulatory protein
MNLVINADPAAEAATLPELVILESKLHPPVLHPEHVSRPRLLQRLDAGMSRRLTLVVAPAGFGKSTVLAEWCATEQVAGRVAWLSLDAQDNDPVVFWSYVVHALRRIEPDRFGASLMSLTAPGVNLTRSVLPRLLNDLWTLEQPVTLVLDDYHEVSNVACHDAVEFFLRRLPPTLRLAIATRSEPMIGPGQLRARGELLELRSTGLRFTDEEAATFLNESLGLGLTAEDLARLEERTEGWAAGLYLAALSMRDRVDRPGFIATFAGNNRHLVDYLGGDVLDRIPEAARTFMLQTSILERYSPALCDAVTGGTDAAARLWDLERTNLFLIPLDEQRQWYRYHHLFGELLQIELSRTQPEAVPLLHGRAALWWRAAGDADAAMRHALAAHDFDLAGALFIEHARPLQQSGRLATTVRWMDQLPADVIATRPALAVAAAGISALASRPPEEMERWLALAEGGDDDGPFWLGEHSLRAAVAIMRAAFLYDDVGRALIAAREAVESEPNPGTPSYMVATGALGQALYLAGDPAEARTILERVIRAPLASRQSVVLFRAFALLALIRLDLAESDRAEDLARQAVRLCEERGLTTHPSAWQAYDALAAVLARGGRFDEAEAVLATGVEPHLPGLARWPVMYAHALLTLAPVRSARGHVLAAQAMLEEARGVIGGCTDPGILPVRLEETERLLQREHRRRRIGLREPLSEGELRILRLLRSDLTQREIARELYLSVNTVKTHMRGIYTKLEVASRAEAVAHARSLGLIA